MNDTISPSSTITSNVNFECLEKVLEAKNSSRYLNQSSTKYYCGKSLMDLLNRAGDGTTIEVRKVKNEYFILKELNNE